MSLKVDFAALAEGVATDARGNLTLVAVNPQILIADQLPWQFSPIMVATAIDDDLANPVIVPGRTMTARIEAIGPDDSLIFVTQLRQPIVPPAIPSLSAKIQVIAQVPFLASKPGEFKVLAHIAVLDQDEKSMGSVTAERTVRVADVTVLRPAAT